MVLRNISVGTGVLFFCFALLNSAFAQDQPELSKKEMKEVSRIFQGEVKVSEVILSGFSISTGQMFREGDLLFKIKGENENRGYLLSTEAKGRYDYFDYSVFYSEELVVKGVVVTVYRSTHGAAICQKKWLSQFNGYDGEKLTLGKEIDAISGATYSAQSIVLDIQRCFALMTGLKTDGIVQ